MHRASRPPFILSPLAHAALRLAFCAALGLACAGLALAQEPAAPMPGERASDAHAAGPQEPLMLKRSPMLAEEVSRAPENKGPTFVFGDRVSGRPDLDTVLDGHAELRRGPSAIRADRIEYYQPTDQVKTSGNVRINNAGNRFEGPELQIKLDSFEGFFTQPSYRFL